MPTVGVTYSETHPVQTELIEETIPDFDIKPVELAAGPLEGDEELLEVAEELDAIVLRPGSITRRLLEKASNLEHVAVHGSGYGRVDLEAATEHGVVVTHNPGGPGPAVAEHALGMMLSLLRDFTGVVERTRDGEWNTARRMNTELDQLTVGVIGLGIIGFDVAQRVSNAFDSRVLGYDPYVMGQRDSLIYPRISAEEAQAAGVELTEFEDLLDESDVVTIHTPLTDDTRHIMGEEEFDRLTDSYFVNTARGGVVDEPALIRAVEEDKLAGVALDVLDTEPPSSDNPLLRSPDVMVTPHTAGVSNGYLDRAAVLSAEKVEEVLQDGQPGTTLNPEVFE